MLVTILASVTKAAGDAWYDRALDSLPRVGELLTAVLGAIALAGIVRGVYRRTINDAGVATDRGGFGDQFMHTFSWSFEGGVADPQLAAARAAAEAGAAPAAELAHVEDIDLDAFNIPEPEEPPRPPQWQAFRRRARVNTYTVIGPELALDDYPLVGDHGLAEYPTAFGVNSGRVRTLE